MLMTLLTSIHHCCWAILEWNDNNKGSWWAWTNTHLNNNSMQLGIKVLCPDGVWHCRLKWLISNWLKGECSTGDLQCVETGMRSPYTCILFISLVLSLYMQIHQCRLLIICLLWANALTPLYPPSSYMGNFHLFWPIVSVFCVYFQWAFGLVQSLSVYKHMHTHKITASFAGNHL